MKPIHDLFVGLVAIALGCFLLGGAIFQYSPLMQLAKSRLLIESVGRPPPAGSSPPSALPPSPSAPSSPPVGESNGNTASYPLHLTIGCGGYLANRGSSCDFMHSKNCEPRAEVISRIQRHERQIDRDIFYCSAERRAKVGRFFITK